MSVHMFTGELLYLDFRLPNLLDFSRIYIKACIVKNAISKFYQSFLSLHTENRETCEIATFWAIISLFTAVTT